MVPFGYAYRMIFKGDLEMKTVILCGGQGTRLRETEFRPKPMVEIGGKPILWHIMKCFAHYQISDFVLCLGYRGRLIKEYFLSYEAMNNDFSLTLGDRTDLQFHGSHEEQNLRVTLADTGLNSMTGGRVRRIERYVRDDKRFFVTYGDGLADINIHDLLRFHESHGKIATLSAVRPMSRYGVLDLSPTGDVNEFDEKPQIDGWINIGFMVFERAIFDYLRPGSDATVLEQDILGKLAADGQLKAYRHEGFFFAMDTYREYLHLNQVWDSGNAPWKIW
jgi:glucose-1-phosphate cytidylyltransferase